MKAKFGALSTAPTIKSTEAVLREVEFLGDSLKAIRQFGRTACHAAGYQLERVQRGAEPDDWKPMPTVGRGVQEIRIWDETGTYRVIYTARLAEVVYVLHAFQKKTQATLKRDINLAKDRLAALIKEIR